MNGRNFDESVIRLVGAVKSTERFYIEQAARTVFLLVEDKMLSSGSFFASIPKSVLYECVEKDLIAKAIKLLSEEGLGCKNDENIETPPKGRFIFFIKNKNLSKRISYLLAEVKCTRVYRVRRAHSTLFKLIWDMMVGSRTGKLSVEIPKYVVFSKVSTDLLDEVLSVLFKEGISYREINGKYRFYIE